MNIIETDLPFNSNYNTRIGDPGGSVLHHAAGNGSVYDVHVGSVGTNMNTANATV